MSPEWHREKKTGSVGAAFQFNPCFDLSSTGSDAPSQGLPELMPRPPNKSPHKVVYGTVLNLPIDIAIESDVPTASAVVHNL